MWLKFDTVPYSSTADVLFLFRALWALENVSTSIEESVEDSAAYLFVYCYRVQKLKL